MKKKLFLLTLAVFLVCGCGKVPKLKNGEDMSEADNNSVNELYNWCIYVQTVINDFAKAI